MNLHPLQHLQGHLVWLVVVQLGYCDEQCWDGWHGDAQEHCDELRDVHGLSDELELRDELNDELGLCDGLGRSDVRDEVKNDVRMWYDG